MASNKRLRSDTSSQSSSNSTAQRTSVRVQHSSTPNNRGNSQRSSTLTRRAKRRKSEVKYVGDMSESDNDTTSGRQSSRKLRQRDRGRRANADEDEDYEMNESENSSESEEMDGNSDHSNESRSASPKLQIGMNVVALDYKGNWCDAVVVAVEKKSRLRIKISHAVSVAGRRKVSPDSKRGTPYTPSKASLSLTGDYGDWIRIHFKGFNSNQDEWIRFDRDGSICVCPAELKSSSCPSSLHSQEEHQSQKSEAGSSSKRQRLIKYTPKMQKHEDRVVERIQQFIEKLDISFSQVCREAKIDSNSNAARNWMKRVNLHQPSTHYAAKQVVEWYNSRRKETDDPGSDVELLSPDEESEPVESVPSRSHTRARRDSVMSNSKLLMNGVVYNASKDTWEGHVTPFREAEPIPLGEFLTAEDAKHATEVARRAITSWKRHHTPEIQLEDKVPTQQNCKVCSKVGDISAMVDCTSCQSYFHKSCAKRESKSDVGGKEFADFLCTDCRGALVAVAADAIRELKGKVDDVEASASREMRVTRQGSTISVNQGKKLSFQTPAKMSSNTQPHRRKRGNGTWKPSRHNSREQRSVNKAAQQVAKPDTEWIGDGFRLDNSHWNHRVYYSAFKFVTSDVVYKILDHVILDRIHDEVCVLNEAGSQGELLEFYIGQLEAIWEEPDGSKKARVAWMFWPEESDLGRTDDNHAHEVYTSSEVDINPLSAVAGKLRVVSQSEYENLKEKVAAKYEEHKGQVDQSKPAYFEKVAKRIVNPYEHRLLFVRHHYHHRASKLVGTDHPARRTGGGACPWVAPFLFSTFDEPDVTRIVEGNATDDQKPIDQFIAKQSSAVADVPDLGEMSMKDKILADESMSRRCGLCLSSLWMEPAIECAVCPSLLLCTDCVAIGRQGLVTFRQSCEEVDKIQGNRSDRTVLANRTEVEQQRTSEGHTATFMHRSHHAYRVSKPILPSTKPDGAQVILDILCQRKGLPKPTYHLVDVCRGPLPTSETKAPPLRLRYGLKVDLPQFGKKGKSKQYAGQILSTLYGNSVQEAKDFVAMEGLKSLFGVGTSLDFPLMQSDWTAWEGFRMLDAIRLKGPAWEYVAELVGTKSPLECRLFFSERILPSWSATVEWKAVQKDPKLYQSSRLGPPSLSMTQTALTHAMEWGERIRAMRSRRALKYTWQPSDSKEKAKDPLERGLLFAMVDGSILQLPNPKKEALRQERLKNPSAAEDPPAPGRCVVCNTGGSERRNRTMLECEACGDQYHLHCVKPPLESLPDSDWLCPNCKEDYEYVQSHSALGETGKALCELIQVYGKSKAPPSSVRVTRNRLNSSTPSGADSVQVMAQALQEQWEKNDQLVRSVVEKAVLLSGAIAKPGARSTRKSLSTPAASNTVTPARSSARLSHQQTITKPPVSVAKPNTATSDFAGESDSLAWTTKHYAAETVSMLELANRGLGEALAAVTAQRDALVQLLVQKGFTPEQLQFMLSSEANFVPDALKGETFELAHK